ncbi:MAG: biotin/lipoyl-binding protein [bacterium]|nr:biotin/lipoyl-binding protein [bacterium]
MKKKENRKTEDLYVEYDRYKTFPPQSKAKLPVDTEVENPLEVKALIPGVIVRINVSDGEEVTAGKVLMILEAMKMRNRIYSKVDGVIEKVMVKEGERVVKNQMLVRIK